MAHIPLEDNSGDVICKAQRGLGLKDEELARLAGVSLEDLHAVQAGRPLVAVARRVARHLRLSPGALEALALKAWYPRTVVLPRGFAMFNTPFGDDLTVNSYLVWDTRSRLAAAFDTGTDCRSMLDTIEGEGLRLRYIFITHNHDDHVAALAPLADGTGAEVWCSEREPDVSSGCRTFRENVHFHLDAISIKTLLTSGHSPGLTTYYVLGLAAPLAVVGDAIFAASMGGSSGAFLEQHRNDREKILTLPRNTVLAPGHGPLTTVAEERVHNPFFARLEPLSRTPGKTPV